MKKWLFLLTFLVLMPIVFAEDNNLIVSFHASGGNESVSINLVEMLKNPGPFKYSDVVNVKIVIENGIAKITPKDPKWVGIEDIIFAPIGAEIKPPAETEAQHQLRAARAARKNITISKDQMDTAMGEFIHQSFFLVTRNLTAQPINITGFVSKNSVNLEINGEVNLSIIMGADRKSASPKFVVDMYEKSANLTLAPYEDPSNWQVYLVFELFIAAIIVVFAYFYTGYAQDLWVEFMAETKTVETKSVSVSIKRGYSAKLFSIKSRIPKEDAKSLSKNTMDLMNSFFSEYVRVTFPGKDRVVDKLIRNGANKAVQNAVSDLYESYNEMMYSGKEPSKAAVSSFISKAGAIIRAV